MPWFKVDDSFVISDKVTAIPRKDRLLAIGLWTYAGNYSARVLNDGLVPQHLLDDIEAPQEMVDHLIRVGLWDLNEAGEIWFHDWCEYQPSGQEYRDKQKAIKEKRSEAGKNGAAKRWDKQDDSKPIANAMANEWQTDSPEPEPEPEPITSNEVITYDQMAFNEFWELVPRKVAKATAEKAFIKATRQTSALEIIEGMRRLANDPNLPETQYIPHPTTWLNAQGWNDDPYPPRGNSKQVQQTQAAERFLASFSQQAELTANPDWA